MKKFMSLFRRADDATLGWADRVAIWLYDRCGVGKVITARLFIFVVLFCALVLDNNHTSVFLTVIVGLMILLCQVAVEWTAKSQGPEKFAAYCEVEYRYHWIRYYTGVLLAYGLVAHYFDHRWAGSLDDLACLLYWYTLAARWPTRPRQRRREDVRSRDLAWSTG